METNFMCGAQKTSASELNNSKVTMLRITDKLAKASLSVDMNISIVSHVFNNWESIPDVSHLPS